MIDTRRNETMILLALVALLSLALIGVISALILIPGSPFLMILGKLTDALLATSSVQALWYVTRAAGLIAYLLLWLSTVWGLAVSSKIFDPLLNRYFTYDMHQFLSLLALGFVVLHVLVLLADRYLPFTIAQIVVPFIAPYRPVWVGVGIIGFYLALLVSITFYIRNLIGYGTFRIIHLISMISFGAAAIHGLMSGTDSPLWATQLMYASTVLVVVFLTVYRIVLALLNAPLGHSRTT